MRRLLTCLLMSALAVCYSVAQKATVISMTETTDFIPGDDQRHDFNKDLCALVKIQVVDEITDVEGNVIGDVVNHGVEKWVYLTKGSKHMTIHLKNNLPLKVIFQNHKINSLKSNRIYILVLDVENKGATNSNVNTTGNDLKMKIFPRHATVTIWSDNMQQKTYRPERDGMLSVKLPYGRYYYLVSANGHHKLEGNVFVNDEHHIESVALSPITGTLIANCPTEKVDFYVSGICKGNNLKRKSSSWKGELPPGSYVVEVFRKGYAPCSKTIKVKANEVTTLDLEPLLTEKAYKKNQKEFIDQTEIRKTVWKKYLKYLQKKAIEKVKEDANRREQSIRDNAICDVIQMMDGSYIPCTIVGSSSSMIMITIDNHKGEIKVPKAEIDYIQYKDGRNEIINPKR